MDKKLIYVDTDVSLGTPAAEIDDGAALILLLRNQDVEVVGAGSVFGNVPVQDAALNLDRLLSLLDGGNIPLGLGAANPLLEDLSWFDDWRSAYGATLPWTPRPTSLFAANLIIQTIRANPGQVTILSLGPMTNLALAVRLDPQITALTKEVIAMGGSFNAQNPAPEFNVRCDPHAAQIVFHAGWDLHTLGLEVTRRVHFSRRDFSSLSAANPAVELLKAQAPGWIDRVEAMGWDQDGCALHDAVAVAYLLDRTLFQAEDRYVEVELADSARRGVTRFSPQENCPVIIVVSDLNIPKCRELIWSYLQQSVLHEIE